MPVTHHGDHIIGQGVLREVRKRIPSSGRESERWYVRERRYIRNPTPEPDHVEIRLHHAEPEMVGMPHCQHLLPRVQLPRHRTPAEVSIEVINLGIYGGGCRSRSRSAYQVTDPQLKSALRSSTLMGVWGGGSMETSRPGYGSRSGYHDQSDKRTRSTSPPPQGRHKT